MGRDGAKGMSEMKKAGASSAAVEFSKQLGEPGFVRDFRAAGPVDVAYVLYPYRANENQSWVIVNGAPPAIDVDNSKLVMIEARALKNNATYAGLARAHPDARLRRDREHAGGIRRPGGAGRGALERGGEEGGECDQLSAAIANPRPAPGWTGIS